LTDDSSFTDNDQVDEYLNPFNIDQYNKFGFTCLHEAIRQRNRPLTDLLLEFNADLNLPILDPNDKTPTSNCFIELAKTQNEELFLFIFHKYIHRVKHETLIDSTITYSIEYMQSDECVNNVQYRVLSNLLPLLIAHTSRVNIDKEYKAQQPNLADNNGT
jgi:hypothetical protein